ncbi:hypothetical protein ABZ656_57235, partial [Streptomyces sp. NPDC007095]|uniref:hypothetical protein n=1 Tax=Streptomyces sp. NPDC007095 TaxID=3154482 RepID=UPI0033E4843A
LTLRLLEADALAPAPWSADVSGKEWSVQPANPRRAQALITELVSGPVGLLATVVLVSRAASPPVTDGLRTLAPVLHRFLGRCIRHHLHVLLRRHLLQAGM